MSDLQYFQIRSWHIVKLWSDRIGRTYSYCGRRKLQAVIVDVLPGGKSCESCARIVLRQLDVQPEPETDEVPA